MTLYGVSRRVGEMDDISRKRGQTRTRDGETTVPNDECAVPTSSVCIVSRLQLPVFVRFGRRRLVELPHLPSDRLVALAGRLWVEYGRRPMTGRTVRVRRESVDHQGPDDDAVPCTLDEDEQLIIHGWEAHVPVGNGG